jgi:5-carboxymethyl-2-hydroxymuconate isomerase
MPHLIIEYSDNLNCDIPLLMEAVYNAAVKSGVMVSEDIKVRAHPYTHFRLAHNQQQFVHVSCRLLAGRTQQQKTGLSEIIRQKLSKILPDIYSLSVEIVDMEPASYKKRLLNPK